LRILFLADCTTDMHDASFQKRQAALFSRGRGPTEAIWQQEEPVDEVKPQAACASGRTSVAV